MSVSQLPLTLIVAATAKNGIGKNGGLPWPMLKKEMAYFARVTKRVPMPSNTGSLQSDSLKQSLLDGTRRNVVIMGRKTWESIPPKFRPLKDRTNIVITRQDPSSMANVPQDVVIATSIEHGLRAFEQEVSEGRSLPAGRAFVIGGSSIYEAALNLPQTKHILLTRVRRDYDCDTFFPVDLEGPGKGVDWQRKNREELQDFVGEELPESPTKEGEHDDEVEYEFCLYQRP